MSANHDHHPVEVDPQAVANAHTLWTNFTKMTTKGVLAVIAILLVMAVFLGH